MAALQDLDSLLGDLEETCSRQPSMSHMQPGLENGHAKLTVNKGPPINHNSHVNELDSLLDDLSKSRFSRSRSKESDAVIREMESSSKMVERRVIVSSNEVVETAVPDKWEYMGYGIWENSDKEQNGGIGSGSGSGFRPIRTAAATDSSTTRTTSARLTSSASSSLTRSSQHQAASSATQELDDLMMSLNDFKLKDRSEEPVCTNLDVMLGNLKEDMDKQGIKTSQKGVCFACQKPIVGQVITAMGRTWHPEHFVCAHCSQELGTKSFFERDGKPYCEDDYQQLFSPRCARCNKAILDKCVSALDQAFHPECFACSDCGKDFGERGFHEKGNRALCQDCYLKLYAPKCGGCNQSITENYISSLDRQWHPNCFVCVECKQPFVGGNFFEHNGLPYCEVHYHAMRGSLCAGCHKPISGRCITAMFRKFHPEHFQCSFCLKQLNKGTFKEQNEKPYCHECFDRLYG